MNIVVIGNGKIGRSITENLAKEGHDLVVIDNNESTLSDTINGHDVMTVCGNGASRVVQTEAGVKNADLVIAVTDGDELNLLCCLVAKKLGAERTIARVRNPEYSDELALIREDLGLSLAINPDFNSAQEIFSVLRFPGVMNVEKFAKGRVELAEFRLPKGSPLSGHSLTELNKRFKVKVLVCAVRRGDETFIPKGDFVFMPEDCISFVASPDESERFLITAGIPVRPPRNTIIVGAGRITFYLTRMLRSIGIRPTVIDSSKEKCRLFSEAFPGCLVLHGDGADRDLLAEEGIDRADAFVAATGTDEVNILLSMYANSQRVPKVVTKVSRFSMVDLVGDENLGSIISPKDITSSQVTSFVRAMENSGASNNVETLYRIVNGTVEALEFIVRENDSRLTDIPLKNLRLKSGLLIGCIIRSNKVIIPDGSACIKTGDRVIVITTIPRLTSLQNIID